MSPESPLSTPDLLSALPAQASQKRLFVISGPSGVGKGTVCQQLRALMPQLSQPVSLTTRRPRPGETHGNEYWFVSRETFEAKQHAQALLEWVEYNGCYYGTETLQVRDALAQGHTLLLEIDAHGALKVKDQFADEAFLIFLAPPSLAELRLRLEKRGTNAADDIDRRLARAEWELSQQERFDWVITNHRIADTVAALHARLQSLTG